MALDLGSCSESGEFHSGQTACRHQKVRRRPQSFAEREQGYCVGGLWRLLLNFGKAESVCQVALVLTKRSAETEDMFGLLAS